MTFCSKICELKRKKKNNISRFVAQFAIISVSLAVFSPLPHNNLIIMEKKDILRLIDEAVDEEKISLSFYSLGISELPPDIERAKHLRYLDLSYNQLSSLPASIAHLPHLTNLCIDYNRFDQLPACVGDCGALEELFLSHNNIKTLPTEIGRLHSLRQLGARSNQLKDLPDTIQDLAALQNLNLAENGFDKIPAFVGNLRQIQEMDWSENALKTVPSSFANLINLRELDLSHNQLVKIPTFIAQLNQLNTLYLGNNQLTAIPNSIEHLTELSLLYLQHNQISEIPPAIGQLTKLRDLNLSYNQIKQLPIEMTNLHCLRYLDLEDNPLESPLNGIIHEGIYAIMLYLQCGLDVTRSERMLRIEIHLERSLQTIAKQFLAAFPDFLQHCHQQSVEWQVSTWKKDTLTVDIKYIDIMDMQLVERYLQNFLQLLSHPTAIDTWISKLSTESVDTFATPMKRLIEHIGTVLQRHHLTAPKFAKTLAAIPARILSEINYHTPQTAPQWGWDNINPGPAN